MSHPPAEAGAPETQELEGAGHAGIIPRSLRRLVRRGSRWVEIDEAPERETR